MPLAIVNPTLESRLPVLADIDVSEESPLEDTEDRIVPEDADPPLLDDCQAGAPLEVVGTGTGPGLGCGSLICRARIGTGLGVWYSLGSSTRMLR